MDCPVLVSACLVGFRCRYDGSHKSHRAILKALEGYSWIPVCPEQRAGLPTPRVPLAFAGGTGQEALRGDAKILQLNGIEVTPVLVRASRLLIRLAKSWGIKKGILKERSPSCGVSTTYVGDKLVEGVGIFTAMLVAEGIEVISEETIRYQGLHHDL